MVISAMLATLGAGAVGVGTTFAATGNAEHKPMSALIEAIATKFNLAPADVQAVFEEHREVMQENRQENRQERREDGLEKAVTVGKLTQAQADAIQENVATQQAFFESLKDMTEEERKDAIEENRESQKAWAEENGIPKAFAPKHGPMMKGNHEMKIRGPGLLRHQNMMESQESE